METPDKVEARAACIAATTAAYLAETIDEGEALRRLRRDANAGWVGSIIVERYDGKDYLVGCDGDSWAAWVDGHEISYDIHKENYLGGFYTEPSPEADFIENRLVNMSMIIAV